MDNDGVVSFPFNFLISQHWNSSLFRGIKSSKSRIPTAESWTTDEDLDMFPHWNQLYFLKKSYISIKIKPIQPSGQRWSRFVSLSCFEISTLKFFFGGFFLCFFHFYFLGRTRNSSRAEAKLTTERRPRYQFASVDDGHEEADERLERCPVSAAIVSAEERGDSSRLSFVSLFVSSLGCPSLFVVPIFVLLRFGPVLISVLSLSLSFVIRFSLFCSLFILFYFFFWKPRRSVWKRHDWTELRCQVQRNTFFFVFVCIRFRFVSVFFLLPLHHRRGGLRQPITKQNLWNTTQNKNKRKQIKLRVRSPDIEWNVLSLFFWSFWCVFFFLMRDATPNDACATTK